MFPRRTLLAALILLLALPIAAQELSRRLVLKDGSFQSVTRYEVHGDRVRYLSAERDEWEELPSALVDWPATDKYEKDRAAGASAPEAVALDKEIADDNARADALLPEVAPGLRLPENSGVFLLDSFKEEPQVNELQQSAGDVVRNTRANILRGAINPVAGVKASIELDGAHAAVQAHVGVPSLYINVDADPNSPDAPKDANRGPQQPQQAQKAEGPVVPFDRFRIVRTEVKGSKRVVGDIKRQVSGKVTQEQHGIKTTVTRVGAGWLKITPIDPLQPGEYAVVEMTGQEGSVGREGMNLYVWDFGVNPKAPANSNPYRPDVKLNPILPDKPVK